jgi:6-phosphogluconate dehydrogenase
MTNKVGCLAVFGFGSSSGAMDGKGDEMGEEGTGLWTFQATLTMDSNVPVSCCATSSAAFMLLRRCRADRVDRLDRLDRVEEEDADEEEDNAVEATAALAEMGSMRIKKCCLSQGCSVMGRRDVFVFNTA